MSGATHWWWVRHAAVPDASGRILGQIDVGCDTSDGQAFQALAAVLPEDPVWVVSPLRRTRQTLAAIGRAGRSIGEPLVEADFAEQAFGSWQGLKWAEMQLQDPLAYARFWRDPTRNAPPGGESFVRLMGRTRAAIDRLTRNHSGRRVVSISHGGTIRAAVAAALGLTPEAAMAIVIDNLSVTRLSHVEDGLLRRRGGVWQVKGVNAPCGWIRGTSA
jgi:broad specificity phosphatase PhoE